MLWAEKSIRSKLKWEEIMFEYYYSRQSEQFTFYRIPKALFAENVFHTIILMARFYMVLYLTAWVHLEKTAGLISWTEYISILLRTKWCPRSSAPEKKPIGWWLRLLPSAVSPRRGSDYKCIWHRTKRRSISRQNLINITFQGESAEQFATLASNAAHGRRHK